MPASTRNTSSQTVAEVAAEYCGYSGTTSSRSQPCAVSASIRERIDGLP